VSAFCSFRNILFVLEALRLLKLIGMDLQETWVLFSRGIATTVVPIEFMQCMCQPTR
jgi:hypothetical protein